MTVATVLVVGSAVIAKICGITAIAVTAVTVDIVAPAGRGRHERASRTVRAAVVSVRRRTTMTIQATVAAQAKEARWELLQTARGRNNQKIQIIIMMKILI